MQIPLLSFGLLFKYLFLPCHPPKSYSNNLYRLIWRQSRIKDPTRFWSLKNICLKRSSQICTLQNVTWTATISVSNVRIILTPPRPLVLIVAYLQLFFFMGRSTIGRFSTSVATRAKVLLL